MSIRSVTPLDTPTPQADGPFPGVRIGVVIPAFRVEAQIERVLAGIPSFVSSIIVVDDASPDETAARVEAVSDERVTLLRHEKNQGVGGAMRTGFAEALRQELDITVKMDGDDQMDPSRLGELVEPLVAGRADMTKGNRYFSISSLRRIPLVRLLGNAGLTFLVKLASGYWNLFDPANGYVALRRNVLQRLHLDKLPSDFFFESALLIELGIRRAVVHDVAIEARYADENSSLSVFKTLVTFPPRLMWGLCRRIFWRYYVLDFTAVSVLLGVGSLLTVSGGIFGLMAWTRMQAAGLYASAGVVMIAALPIILGVQMLLQAITLDVNGVPSVPLSHGRLGSKRDREGADHDG